MKYFSGVLQVKVKVTFSPGFILSSDPMTFLTLTWQLGETPGLSLIVTVMLSTVRREIVKEAKKDRHVLLLACMSITSISTHPHRCHIIRRNISIHVLKSPWCWTYRKCLGSSSPAQMTHKNACCMCPERSIHGTCVGPVLLQFTFTSAIYSTFKK